MAGQTNDEIKRRIERCKACYHCHIVGTQNKPVFQFRGCYHSPYKGKWVIEIEDCPIGGVSYVGSI